MRWTRKTKDYMPGKVKRHSTAAKRKSRTVFRRQAGESEERAPQEKYSARQLQEGIPYPTLKQEMEIQAEAIKLAEKILSEVGKDPDVDRIDEDTVRTVAALNFGFAKGYVEPNKSGLHVAFRFVDLSMADCITAVHNPPPSRIPRYDRPWNTSPSFIQAYKSALKSSLDLCEKFPNLVERNYVIQIKDEWNKICADEATI